MGLSTYANWLYLAVIISSILIFATNRSHFLRAARIVWSFPALAALLVLGQAASYALGEISLKENLGILMSNLLHIVVFGLAGVTGAAMMIRQGVECDEVFKWMAPDPPRVRIIFEVGVVYNLGAMVVFFHKPFWDGWTHWSKALGTTLAFANAAVIEELMYRVFILTALSLLLRKVKGGWTIAAIVMSLFWTLMHSMEGVTIYERFCLVFPLGFSLALVFKRYGFLTALLAHVAVNWISLLTFTLVSSLK